LLRLTERARSNVVAAQTAAAAGRQREAVRFLSSSLAAMSRFDRTLQGREFATSADSVLVPILAREVHSLESDLLALGGTCTTCAVVPPGGCGDAECDAPRETCRSCAEDCGACPRVCETQRCDVALAATCGACTTGCDPCCPLCKRCGDGVCEGDEDCHSCTADCGACRGGKPQNCFDRFAKWLRRLSCRDRPPSK
jgi:hypothetical protein